MRRWVLATYALVIGCLLAGVWIGRQAGPAHAQSAYSTAITPMPGRHAEVRTAFSFFVKDTPNQTGWRAAEFKDEGSLRYWKTDASPGCALWSTFGDDPGLILSPGATDCAAGWKVEHGYFYWFASPIVPASPPATNTPAATGTPPLGATATPGRATPTPTSASSAEPSLPIPTPTRTGTPGLPALPDCASSIWLYRAGDPAAGGLGGKVGDVGWCEGCKHEGSCGVWSLGVDQRTLDDINAYIKSRIVR